MKVSDLVAGVVTDGNLDVKEPQALRWLNSKHKLMCARSGCYRKTFDLGTGAAGQSGYVLPAAVHEILEVTVGGLPYPQARHSDLALATRGYLWVRGEGGLAAEDEDAEGVTVLRLLPTPEVGSAPVTSEAKVLVYAVARPPDLAAGVDATIKVPDEFEDALVSGALASAMLRDEALAGLAAQHQQAFDQGCQELRRNVNTRFRGAGPNRVRIAGVNA